MKRFTSPVLVTSSKPGCIDEISNPQSALDRLHDWDNRSNVEWLTAVEVCAAALDDNATLGQARAAFETAARSTGNLIPAA